MKKSMPFNRSKQHLAESSHRSRFARTHFLFLSRNRFLTDEFLILKRLELEFLIEISGDVTAIEVKSGCITKAKSLKVFIEKYTPAFQVILSSRPMNSNISQGLFYYPLYLAGQLKALIEKTL